jgi:hypothetical protein
MDGIEKKSDRIPVTKKTRIRMRKYYVNEGFANYDEGLNNLLDKVEKSSK